MDRIVESGNLGGRPSKYTEDVIERLCHSLSLGASQRDACMSAGISEDSIIDWKKKDRAGVEKFSGFNERLEKAQGEATDRWLSYIEAAAQKPQHWTAAAWKLERCRRDYNKDKLDKILDRLEVIDLNFEAARKSDQNEDAS